MTLNCEHKGRKFKCDFFLSDVTGPILLGLPTGEALGIVTIAAAIEEQKLSSASPFAHQTGYIHPDSPLTERPPIRNKEDLKDMYPECFQNTDKYFPDCLQYSVKQTCEAFYTYCEASSTRTQAKSEKKAQPNGGGWNTEEG